MSTSALNQTLLEPAAGRSPLQRTRSAARWAARIVLSPVRLFLSIRASMTAASVTLLVVGIVTLNIVWGYPWSGMFSACVSLMIVGFAINRIMRPKLEIGFSLPRSSPAGQPFSFITHLMNRSRLPAMDFEVVLEDESKRHRKRHRKRVDSPSRQVSVPQVISVVRPEETMNLRGMLVFDQRGIHPLPDVSVTSMFPFHLFRSARRYPSGTSIAITPKRLDGTEDVLARGLLDALGHWSHRLLSGDALDYTGSREYVVGMPVRRWDFTSWARLGRPIVREFQSPSIQTVMLVVDTSVDNLQPTSDGDSMVERVLSLAATAIGQLTLKMVRVELSVTGEPLSQIVAPGLSQIPSDSESLLIRLAAAEPVSPAEADEHVHCVIDQIGRMPILVLTAGPEARWQQNAPPNLTILRVDPPQDVRQGPTLQNTLVTDR